MPATSAQTISARQGLLLLVVVTAAFSVYLSALASHEDYDNGLFASNGPGGGMSIPGTVDRVITGARSKTGHRLDILYVTYDIGFPFPSFHEKTLADESISRTLHPGDPVPLRVWGDGPEMARVDVPSETARYVRIERTHAFAAALALAACVFCGWGWSRAFRFSKIS